MKKVLAVVAILAALVGVGPAVLWLGLYDVSATDPHLAPTHRLLDVALKRSVLFREARIAPAPPADAGRLERGLAIFHAHCVQCHGGPGVAPEPFALGLTPSAANLALTGREWSARQIYWVVSEGIKMTGMPAWRYRMPEADLWAVTLFVKERLPWMSPSEYREQAARARAPREFPIPASSVPDPERGRMAMHQYACTTCHAIPGVTGASAPVGPPLERMARRDYIAGFLPNTRENMVRWLQQPHEIDPGSAMPPLYVNDRDAVDMAAYLATLR